MINAIQEMQRDKPLILLVDDLPANLHVMIAALKADFRLKTATSGVSAMALLDGGAECPKLLIVDVRMPGMSGIDMLRRMRAAPHLCDIPVILVSADASEQFQTTGLDLGADDYLVKPIFRDTLIIRARNLIQRSEERDKLRLAGHVFDFSGEAIMVTDANNDIVDVNAAFIKLTGYSKAEVLGRNPRLLASSRNTREHFRLMWDTINADGYWQGELWQTRKDGSVHPKFMTVSVVRDRNGEIEYFLTNSVDISEYKESERRIAHLAHHDVLTGLPNRLHLQIYLDQSILIARRMGEQLAVMFLDLDRFKNVNDTLGHPVGDELLIEVAARLKSCIRDYDVVARLGGDEFVVILRGAEILSDAIAVAKKLNHRLSQPFVIGAHTLRLSASIGIALYPDNALTIDDLMKNADTSMYFAKSDGGNAFRFFSPAMDLGAHEKLKMESQLYEAIERHEFELHYQLQVDQHGRPRGAEALIRWHHPEDGMVGPDQFIPLAEESGLILPIGHWVLEQACARIRAWQGDARTCTLVLAVNVSARQFRQPDFALQVRAAVQRHGIDPALLKLEITESLLLKKVDEVVAIIAEIKALGVGFSLDDFGAGYSCLQYLKRLPLDQIKIDRSFVRDLATNDSDKAIVRTIIAMAANMKMAVIAEGVETEEQRRILLAIGCSDFQGYLFGCPLPVAAFEAALAMAP
ncbi:putative bifunctional diguanylate cyclase/phosphodiesterase [Massilia sp. DWR3-1-1]|uniref:putative bifunctional diguanylate cyclase/phosphodiesterase n=1 Tax=Massilia sp. DWR3-1-1 TaxID=2804559 RepID=UPI003CE74193